MTHIFGFSTPLGWVILVISVIIGLVMLVNKKKIFPLLYISSAATYAYGIGFIIDKFHLSDAGVFGLLIISGIIMILLGIYLRSSSKDY